MITNFEEITKELDHNEKIMINILVNGFKNHDKDTPVKAPYIVKAINTNYKGFGLTKKLTEARMRKMINFIRTHGIIPLIATSNGYYVSYDKEEISKQIKSLEERASAIISAANGLRKTL